MADRALLVGVNQYKTISSLRGCRNDVARMRELLVELFGFDEREIRVREDGDAIRTILDEDMNWLVQDAGAGDRLLLHFSGHGSYTVDNDDEPGEGGQDELLCLYNMDWDDPDSYLLDDEIAAFTSRVPDGARLVIVLDSCHSGTGSRAETAKRSSSRTPDYKIPRVKEVEGGARSPRSTSSRKSAADRDAETFRIRFVPPPDRIQRLISETRGRGRPFGRLREAVQVPGLNHILLAGAKDIETAADAYIDGDYYGAFTYHLTDAFRELGRDADLGDLIDRVESAVKRFGQTPQLEAEIVSGPLFGGDEQNRIDVGEVPGPDPGAPVIPDPQPGGIDPETFRQLLATYNRLIDLASAGGPTGAGGRWSDIESRAAGRHLVAVHGIGRHADGYSNGWWNALRPFAPSLRPGDLAVPGAPGGNRHEVNWSNIVNRSATVGRRELEDTSEEIKETLRDRADQASENTGDRSRAASTTARGSANNLISSVDDFTVYLLDRPTRNQIIERFHRVVRPLLEGGAELEIISHSWGTVVAYEGLVLLDREASGFSGRVRNFFTVGSALSIGPVRSRMLREAEDGHKPTLVGNWVNIDARYDIVGGRLERHFAVTREFLGLDPVGCWPLDAVCSHSSYFDTRNVFVNRNIFGHFIEGRGAGAPQAPPHQIEAC